MAISKTLFSSYIKAFRFVDLFNEMGWNLNRSEQTITVDGTPFHLKGVAEKSGFKVFLCRPPAGDKLPDSAVRKKIELKVWRLFPEHLILFTDDQRREMVWQLAVRKAGSPNRISETRYLLSQDPELLYQRAGGLIFTLDEEERVTIVDVTQRIAYNLQMNNERVTKRFYESFKKEHTAFLKHIQGIDDDPSREWYASLLLNRLMFCYFIQKKGFLDDNRNYLQDKLGECARQKGKNRFLSFYRDFLLALFHRGLGAPEQERPKPSSTAVAIGKIPYLNGGLFEEHEIERTFKKIQIEDRAFERIFEFFDQYEWHLDTREKADGREINPDVIGYIFEKYINDRAQMGAYYTKEDITDYIAKNCILPWLFDEVKRHDPKAFSADGPIWQMVRMSGDDYIYEAIKKGIPDTEGLFDDLPREIRRGFAPDLEKKTVNGKGPWLWQLRSDWNRPAPAEIALPTETWRELIERRRRYAELKEKMEKGEIREINEFITCNLNIRQFAQDVVEATGDAEFLRHFYQALSGITILDPTCGSGAFLFAALNILEPLYEASLQRMDDFCRESGRGKHLFFEKTLALARSPEHPNLQYFIYKSIILNNLYGVDIMNEATEIAKLRLFLKLVATVEADYGKPNLGLEPLPDIDFNLRTGNTLVGYATENQLKKAFVGRLDFDRDAERIKEECDVVARAFRRYKEIQLTGHSDFSDFKKAKDDLNQRLDKLRRELDVLLHKQHYPNEKFNSWLTTHQPFHWFAEFYEIVTANYGFDVIIGNPPYVELKAVSNYKAINFQCIKAGNLYALSIERCSHLINVSGRQGFIVPVSSISTDRYQSLQTVLLMNDLWSSAYDDRPSRLFEGLEHIRLTIHLIGIKKTKPLFFSTKYNKWNAEERNFLFDTLKYVSSPQTLIEGSLPKLTAFNENKIAEKLLTQQCTLSSFFAASSEKQIFYSRKVGYFIQALDFIPKVFDGNNKLRSPSEFKDIRFNKSSYADAALCCLNSNLFYWFITVLSDCRHVNKREIEAFPIDLLRFSDGLLKSDITQIINKLMTDLSSNSIDRCMTFSHDTLKVQCIMPKLSKPIIDQIDCLLAQHYGFTQEELDFIINYDIKYRMGKELTGEEESDG